MKCLICDKECERFEDTRWRIEYYECYSCGFVMKSTKNFSSFSEQKQRYDLHNNNQESEGYRAYFERFVNFLLPHINQPQNALDFGCGASSLLAQILTHNQISTDFYDPIYHPKEVYKDKKYDLIVSVEVFEHLHTPKEIFKMLVDHLNPKGYLAIQTAFYAEDRERFLNWHYRLDPTHVLFFSLKSLAVLATEFEMKIIKSDVKQMILMQKIN